MVKFDSALLHSLCFYVLLQIVGGVRTVKSTEDNKRHTNYEDAVG